MPGGATSYICRPAATGGNGMPTLVFPHSRTLLAMLGSLLILSGCASQRYGTPHRKKRGCDCPKWNAAPAPATPEYRVEQHRPPPDLACFSDATHH